jgi:AraC-like DNA-binding protein
MPSSAIHTFADPDDYATSFQEAQVEITVTERGHFTAELTRIDLHRVRMQRFSDDQPRIAHSALAIGTAMFSWLTQPGPLQLSSGTEMQSTGIMRHSEGRSNYLRSSGFARYGSISFPLEDVAAAVGVTAGIDVTPPHDSMLITPPPAAMIRLQRLHAAAGHLAANAPEIIANPNAALGLEQSLIEALVGCLDHRQTREDSVAFAKHESVMRRFRRVLEDNPEEPLFIPAVCNAIGVSARTLLLCCQEHLGIGPKRYLLLRRMHFARQALRRAHPVTISVTEIATRHGFWELGRFSVQYKNLFGESPSVTLRRQVS